MGGRTDGNSLSLLARWWQAEGDGGLWAICAASRSSCALPAARRGNGMWQQRGGGALPRGRRHPRLATPSQSLVQIQSVSEEKTHACHPCQLLLA